jgi:hypothetical protein
LGGKEPLSINKVGALGYADGDARHYERANKGSYDIADAHKTVALRNKFLLNVSTTGPKVALVKTHSYNSTINETPLIPASFTKGALYVVRHPGDVAISFASHYGLSIDDAIARMAEPRAVVGGSDVTALQFTSDWSSHVKSWISAKQHNVHVIRYEDMHDAPQKVFRNVLRHVGVKPDEKQLNRAIQNAHFDELQKQEKAEGFSENTTHQPRFFRTGKAGGWRDILNTTQISALKDTHEKVMQTLGYTWA